MNIVVAIDSFKGSMTSLEAGKKIKEGFLNVYPDGKAEICPMADGGEGTVEAIVLSNNGEFVSCEVSDPLMRKIKARYGISDKTAIIEMSEASGITLVSNEERNPLNTTTFGTGELIKDAIKKGCRNFVIGIGGSATNDGGTGMLSALGFQFLDEFDNEISKNGKGLKDIKTIKTENALKELKECTFTVACDVKNPLCGDNGCSRIYGPQKGATEEIIKDMDSWLKNYASLTKTVNKNADESYPGAGAAGGMGFAFLSYLNAELKSGIDIVIKETKLEEKVKNADIVITGEGRLDGQSIMGKTPIGVANIAKKYNKKVLAFAGGINDDAKILNENGIDAFFSILKKPCALDEAMKKENAENNIKDLTEQVFRTIKMTEGFYV